VTRDDIVLLYEFDRWATNRVFHAVSALTPEQFTRDLGGGFRSVRDALVHIVGGEWGWIAYWQEPSHSPAFLEDLWARHDSLFTPHAFPDLASVQATWTEMEKGQTDFVNRLSDESLGRTFPVRATQLSLAHLMQHLVHHSTYYRDQIALMLRQLGARPAATDFHGFLEEASLTPAAPKTESRL